MDQYGKKGYEEKVKEKNEYNLYVLLGYNIVYSVKINCHERIRA